MQRPISSSEDQQAAPADYGRHMQDDRLQGWKGVAAYLGVSTRTAQRWHKDLGLPVHHMQIHLGPTIWASESELSEWIASREVQKEEALHGSLAEAQKIRSLPGLLAIGAALATVALLIARPIWWQPSVDPSSRYRLEYEEVSAEGVGTDLKVLGPRGRPVLTLEFDNVVVRPILAPTNASHQLLLIGFGGGPGPRASHVAALGLDGVEMWAFDMFDVSRLREVQTEENPVSAVMRVRDVLVSHIGSRQVVIAIAYDEVWADSRIALLDLATGDLLAEYWHPGRIGYGRALLADLNTDGEDELYLLGFNNDLSGQLVPLDAHSAVVAAFDVESFLDWGAAQAWPPRWPSLPVRIPRWYYLIPSLPGEVGTIIRAALEDDDLDGTVDVRFLTYEGRYYHFAGTGELLSASAGHQWHWQYGFTAQPPEPMRIGHFAAAIGECWRRDPLAASRQLRLAVENAEIQPVKAAEWEARCEEIAGSGTPIDSGLRLRQMWNEPPYVRVVYPDTPAESAGILPGDVILSVDGVPTADGLELEYLVQRRRPGDLLVLRVDRAGETLPVALRLAGAHPSAADTAVEMTSR